MLDGKTSSPRSLALEIILLWGGDLCLKKSLGASEEVFFKSLLLLKLAYFLFFFFFMLLGILKAFSSQNLAACFLAAPAVPSSW